MAQESSLSMDLDRMALALADPSLPMEKRVEFERQLEAIRLKKVALSGRSGASHAHNAGPLRRLG